MKGMTRIRLCVYATSALAILAVGLGLLAPTAYAAAGLTVLADATTAPVHPGKTTFVSVTVENDGDVATADPVSVTFSATGGKVVGVDNLGFPVDCTVSHGKGSCFTENPIGSSHVVELSVEVRVTGGGRGKVATLTSTAESPADGLRGSATTTIPIT
jgi:hypothetical protein